MNPTTSILNDLITAGYSWRRDATRNEITIKNPQGESVILDEDKFLTMDVADVQVALNTAQYAAAVPAPPFAVSPGTLLKQDSREWRWRDIYREAYPISVNYNTEIVSIYNRTKTFVVQFTLEEFHADTDDTGHSDAAIQLRIDNGTPSTTKEERTMLEKLIRLYTAYMAQDVRSPTPHLAGPPGTSKSESVEQLAKLLGVKLHILNVARMSPLEIEGVQMPVTTDNETKLHMLHSTIWTQLREGDIVFLDEFMRGFPEVYNGLLDIMTSRQVAGFHLPKVFFVAASNSIAAYDKALEDRLLHIFVADIRKSQTARLRVKEQFVKELGLNPKMTKSSEIDELFNAEVLPMYEILDQFKGTAAKGSTTIKGQSARKLAGMVKLREVSNDLLQELIQYNNTISLAEGKAQFVVLLSGKKPDPKYVKLAKELQAPAIHAKLTELQAVNLQLNLDLIAMDEAGNESLTNNEEESTDDPDIF